MDRRTLEVKIASIGIWTDQAIEIAGFELVGIFGEGFQVANAVVTGAGGETIAEGERAQGCIPPGAAAANRQAVGIDLAARDEMTRAVDAIIDVDDTPSPGEALSARATIPQAAAVIDIENGNATAGPILDRIFQ